MFVILEDGTRCPITNMLDIDGDETDDREMVCHVIAQLPDGRWLRQEVGPEMWAPAEAN